MKLLKLSINLMILTVILIFVFLIGFIIMAFTGCYSKATVDISNYDDDVSCLNGDIFMPNLKDLEDYQDIKYTHIENVSLFPSEGCDLTVTYSAENYEKAKKWTEGNYSFLSNPQTADYCYEGEYTIPVTEFSIDKYDFRVAKHPNFEYPKNFGIIGFSDSAYTISYLWFYSTDLDIISMQGDDKYSAMIDFMNDNFGWEKRH